MTEKGVFYYIVLNIAALLYDIVSHAAWQSTTADSASAASLAIDGAVSGALSDNACALTRGGRDINTHYPSWWSVDLGATKRVYFVKLWTADDAGACATIQYTYRVHAQKSLHAKITFAKN